MSKGVNILLGQPVLLYSVIVYLYWLLHGNILNIALPSGIQYYSYQNPRKGKIIADSVITTIPIAFMSTT